MLKKICKYCKKEFFVENNMGGTKYCSECKNLFVECSTCGKIFLLGENATRRYRKNNGIGEYFCSNKCVQLHPKTQDKIKQTTYKHYGVYNASQSKEIKRRKVETTRKNYGVDNPSQDSKIINKKKRTYKKRTGYNWGKAPKTKNKRKQTYKMYSGYDYPMQNPNVQEKAQKTTYNNFGVLHPAQSKKVQKKMSETYRNRTGYKNSMQNPEVIKNRKRSYKEKTGYDHPSQNPEVIKNRKRNYKEKTGYEYPTQNPEVIKKREQNYKQKTGYKNPGQNPEVQEKITQTRIKNESIPITEQYFMQLLQEKGLEINKDFKMQYKTKDYPFFCDFFIISKKLYIELNIHWAHGGCWYNKNNIENQDKLEKWKNKAEKSKYYQHAVEVWSNNDIKKREAAKKNTLNYVVLWNKKDIDKWFQLGMPSGKDWKKEYTWS